MVDIFLTDQFEKGRHECRLKIFVIKNFSRDIKI